MFQWMAEGAADYAPTNQNIFFLGARMPEKVPDSAIKFYEDRFVNLWRFADEQLAKTQYLAVLSFPAIAEADEVHEIETIWEPQRFTRLQGEALHPDREPLETLDRIRRTI